MQADVSLKTKFNQLIAIRDRLANTPLTSKLGVVQKVSSSMLVVAYSGLKLGDICFVPRNEAHERVFAEVIGTEKEIAYLAVLGDASGVGVGDLVVFSNKNISFPFGEGLLGKILNGMGHVMDGVKPVGHFENRASKQPAPSPMDRPLITEPLQTGLRSIDGLLTLGRGQRIGIFGPAGTGKSSLLSSIAKKTDADVVVIGLIGERGREVREFVQRHLPEDVRKKIIIVAATSDQPAMERVYAAHTATSIAEGFRDQGKSVLLMMDSLTRFARALREIGLAAGEPPTRRGYPASVYPALPSLIERPGRTGKGDITAIYTVLVEGEVQSDPIAEEVRSLTDGHVILSQEMANAGIYPAIDVSQSLSRMMSDIVPQQHSQAANHFRSLLSKYNDIEMLLQIGEYKPGQDTEADQAIALKPAKDAFVKQKSGEYQPIKDTVQNLVEMFQ